MDGALPAAGPIVAPTKLHVPGGGALVPRDAGLAQRLAATTGLALVTAPTAVVAGWMAQERRPLAWLSLDPEDADPVRLWRCLIAALRRLQPGLGRDAEAILAAGPAAVGDVVVPLVAAEVAAWDEPVALVLDGAEAWGERSAEVVPSLGRWLDVAPEGSLLLVAAAEPAALAALSEGLGAAIEPAPARSVVGSSRARTPGTPDA
ncbi:MAG TPA: hypothetical protein VNT03_04175, partial [Baekduia sp.]|nr:hypothetical protein [Baekduia sp.]